MTIEDCYFFETVALAIINKFYAWFHLGPYNYILFGSVVAIRLCVTLGADNLVPIVFLIQRKNVTVLYYPVNRIVLCYISLDQLHEVSVTLFHAIY